MWFLTFLPVQRFSPGSEPATWGTFANHASPVLPAHFTSHLTVRRADRPPCPCTVTPLPSPLTSSELSCYLFQTQDSLCSSLANPGTNSYFLTVGCFIMEFQIYGQWTVQHNGPPCAPPPAAAVAAIRPPPVICACVLFWLVHICFIGERRAEFVN